MAAGAENKATMIKSQSHSQTLAAEDLIMIPVTQYDTVCSSFFAPHDPCFYRYPIRKIILSITLDRNPAIFGGRVSARPQKLQGLAKSSIDPSCVFSQSYYASIIAAAAGVLYRCPFALIKSPVAYQSLLFF